MQPDPIKDFFLTTNPNLARDGCPTPEIIRAIASNKLSPTDPARLHLAECSPCFSDFRALKESYIQKRKRNQKFIALLVAPCLLIAAALAITVSTSYTKKPNTNLSLVTARTVDLSNYGTIRGTTELNQLDAVSLPSAQVKVTVLLPKLSDPGTYTIAVSQDRSSNHVLTSATGIAHGDDHNRNVTVLLDLRATHPGKYLLATTHDNDEASYFYPLRVN